jgi:hypothetical protein
MRASETGTGFRRESGVMTANEAAVPEETALDDTVTREEIVRLHRIIERLRHTHHLVRRKGVHKVRPGRPRGTAVMSDKRELVEPECIG